MATKVAALYSLLKEPPSFHSLPVAVKDAWTRFCASTSLKSNQDQVLPLLDDNTSLLGDLNTLKQTNLTSYASTWLLDCMFQRCTLIYIPRFLDALSSNADCLSNYQASTHHFISSLSEFHSNVMACATFLHNVDAILYHDLNSKSSSALSEPVFLMRVAAAMDKINKKNNFLSQYTDTLIQTLYTIIGTEAQMRRKNGDDNESSIVDSILAKEEASGNIDADISMSKDDDDDEAAVEEEGEEEEEKPIDFFQMESEEEIRDEAVVLSSVLSSLQQVHALHLFDTIRPSSMRRLVSLIDKRIKFCAADRFSERVRPALMEWRTRVLIPILKCIFLPTSSSSSSSSQMQSVFESHSLRLIAATDKSLASLLISQLFDIIVDFPDSIPALDDLKDCFGSSAEDQHQELVSVLKKSLKQRLLQAGANTGDIITQYISTIRAMTRLDPTGVTLKAISQPIAAYLRRRADAIRCIVSGLVDEQSELYGELKAASEPTAAKKSDVVGFKPREEEDKDKEGDEEEEEEDNRPAGYSELYASDDDLFAWEPPPLRPDPSRSGRNGAAVDIIRTLINVYGTKELFVAEYRNLLSEKLLACTDYETERELRILELLKIRFGENSLSACDVMVKDIADSKRANTNIKARAAALLLDDDIPGDGVQHQGGADARATVELAHYHHQSSSSSAAAAAAPSLFDSTIVSRVFWPELDDEEEYEVTLHPVAKSLMEEYEKHYHALKAPRKLVWKSSLGFVDLELEFPQQGGRTLSVSCTPIQASLLLHFCDRPKWRLVELAEAMNLEADVTRRRLIYWINQGIIKEEKKEQDGDDGEFEYELTEDAGSPSSSSSADGVMREISATSNAAASAPSAQQQEDGMRMYESFIFGMLKNFSTMPLDRIHSMLKLFVTDHPYEKSLPELQSFLGKLVSEKKLSVDEGLYRLR